MKIKKNVTLVEICFAIAIFAFAIVPMFGAINRNYRNAQLATNLRVMADRAKKILVDVVDRATYRSLHEAGGDKKYENVDMFSGDIDGTQWPEIEEIKDFTKIKWYNPVTKRDEALVKLNEIPDNGKTDCAPECYWVDESGTYYRERGMRFNMYLKVQTIPIVFYYKRFKADLSTEDARIRAVTREAGGKDTASICRDMFKQVILYIEFTGLDDEIKRYEFVTFKANLGADYDND